jgi:non-heme chloroperoxidase
MKLRISSAPAVPSEIRSQFYKDITIPFYGYNRPGAVISEGIRENWWRQGMMGATIAHYECIQS